MLFDYDALIAGAGPAGCAAAYDLAQAGRRVLLLDRRSFPRHKACACGLTRKTLAALRYSVDPIVERVCHEIVLQTGEEPGAPHPAAGTRVGIANKFSEVRVRARSPIAAMAVRERFDAFCLAQTLASACNGGGVTLRKIDTLLSVEEFPTHIALTLATSNGTETLTAPVLIGADGSNGQTRRLEANLPTPCEAEGEAGFGRGPSADPVWYTHGFALEACVAYNALPAQLPAGDHPTDLIFDFAPLPGGYGWLFPKADHINIGVGAFAPHDAAVSTHLRQVTRQLLADYALHKLGVSLSALGVTITGQHLGMGGHAYTPRGRVLLTGDAAGLVDPLTGEGIHSAIVSGQAAAAAILDSIPHPNRVSSPWKRSAGARSASETTTPAAAYARRLRPLQHTLAFSARAARSFYANPERGFRAMRNPLLRPLILKTYADGLPHVRLITALAKLV